MHSEPMITVNGLWSAPGYPTINPSAPDFETAASITHQQRGAFMSEKDADKLPSLKEIDAMALSLPNAHQCTVLCQDLLVALEELQGATGLLKIRLKVRIAALRAQMKALHCGLCLPE